ncbi:MAG: efflux RND transporter permease subunit, partial [Oscillospiraceae bacterium]
LARAGALRMRPIFMTTLTTVLAMIPMAVNTKGNAALMNGMAMVIIGGLMASTVLALLLLPSFYMLVDRKEREKKQKKSKKEKTLPAART